MVATDCQWGGSSPSQDRHVSGRSSLDMGNSHSSEIDFLNSFHSVYEYAELCVWQVAGCARLLYPLLPLLAAAMTWMSTSVAKSSFVADKRQRDNQHQETGDRLFLRLFRIAGDRLGIERVRIDMHCPHPTASHWRPRGGRQAPKSRRSGIKPALPAMGPTLAEPVMAAIPVATFRKITGAMIITSFAMSG
ncbi:hypothetical protein I6F15_32270 [Bradyrhizobium sp. BRP14]|nr:hypothetical protein [Bradyrhizobium sp. BRP14]